MLSGKAQLALPGVILGAVIEAFSEVSKELRVYAGGETNKRLDELERRALRSVDNVALDFLPEDDQLVILRETRKIIRSMFADARNV